MANTPKSAKLKREESELMKRDGAHVLSVPIDVNVSIDDGEPIKIKRVECYNDFVAILQFRVDTTIQLDEKSAYKNEGIVIGVGPGIATAGGNRCPVVVNVGDVVSFYGNAVTQINSQGNSIYRGKRIVVVTERQLLVRLAPVPFVLVPAE